MSQASQSTRCVCIHQHNRETTDLCIRPHLSPQTLQTYLTEQNLTGIFPAASRALGVNTAFLATNGAAISADLAGKCSWWYETVCNGILTRSFSCSTFQDNDCRKSADRNGRTAATRYCPTRPPIHGTSTSTVIREWQLNLKKNAFYIALADTSNPFKFPASLDTGIRRLFKIQAAC